jgi:hypothetical protein
MNVVYCELLVPNNHCLTAMSIQNLESAVTLVNPTCLLALLSNARVDRCGCLGTVEASVRPLAFGTIDRVPAFDESITKALAQMSAGRHSFQLALTKCGRLLWLVTSMA